MYVTRRDIGVTNAPPSRQKSKLSGRKTARSDGQVQRRKVVNSILKLVKPYMAIGKIVMVVQET